MQRVGEYAYLLRAQSADHAIAAYRRVAAASLDGVDDIVPGAQSVLVVFRHVPREADAQRLEEIEGAAVPEAPLHAAGREHEIAVHYDGPDLADVATTAGLSVARVIDLHSSAAYRVAFLGFQPGFAYLAGLPAALCIARRTSPRAQIPAGSLAIGGAWTGVYPSSSPGGWNLIGGTDVPFFDSSADPPARLGPGDRVRFVVR